jgi:hypothetical protein
MMNPIVSDPYHVCAAAFAKPQVKLLIGVSDPYRP